METNIWFWVVFNLFVLAMLALDLGVFHRKEHAVGLREALGWSVAWISMALIFNLGIYLYAGREPALEFLAGYLIEKSLSVDNIFVFVLIFSAFAVPPALQHRVLFWGILGALVMRGIFIGLGAWLIASFHWIIYIFGAFLVFTGIRMALEQEHEVDLEANRVVRLARRFLPLTEGYRGSHFMVVQNDRRYFTPLFLVLLVVESSDLIFAVDSIPAIFAVTKDPFLVYSSNVFAILGLRSLYFVLAGVIDRFHLLRLGLSIILVFVGIKMLIADLYHVPIGISLGVIALVLLTSVLLSLAFPKAAEMDLPGGAGG
jgi:tellurite resistance protein TerC